MLTKFNTLYFNIITEQDTSEQNINLNSDRPIIPENPTYQDLKIAMVPGSFKPPHKGHWEMILEYCNIADIVMIFISNISTKIISNRPLSKSNLQPIAKLISNIQQLKLKDQTIDDICNQIIDNNDNLSYNDLKGLLDKLIEQFNLYRNIYDEYITQINKIKDKLNKTLFKSIRKTSDNKEIEPEMAKQIFELYINKYNLQNKVFVNISENPSPMTDIVSYVNNNCKNCIIYLGSSKKGDDSERWDSFLKSFGRNPTNQIVPYAIEVKTNISASDLRSNFNNLDNSVFPNNLSNSDINTIKDILNIN